MNRQPRRSTIHRTLFGAALAAATVLASRQASANTIVNVSSMTALYNAFRTADLNPSKTYEVHLASGVYNPIAASGNDTSPTSGALKLTKGHVIVVGGATVDDAVSYSLNGNKLFLAAFLVKPAAGFSPSLDLQGIEITNFMPGGNAVVDVQGGLVTIEHCYIDFNVTAGSAIEGIAGTTQIYHSWINNNIAASIKFGGPIPTCGGVFEAGGGLRVTQANAVVVGSSFIANQSCEGGAIDIDNASSSFSVDIENSTIAANTAPMRGGGIFVRGGQGRIDLHFNDIAGNRTATYPLGGTAQTPRYGGGIAFAQFRGQLNMSGNIIANNDASTRPSFAQAGHDCYVDGVFVPPGNLVYNINLIGKIGSCTFATGPAWSLGTDANPVDPRLGFMDNVATLWGFMPLYQGFNKGSPAVASYNNAAGQLCPALDQRGQLRLSDQCDLGAYEVSTAACSHDVCTPGPNLSTDCSSDVATVCSSDPYCCNTMWDPVCVSEVPGGCS